MQTKLRQLAFTSALLYLAVIPAHAEYKVKINDQSHVVAGFWMQGWYQFTGEERAGRGVSDFILRRGYFSLRGEVTPWFGAFVHIAADRVGQDGLDQPSVGLGSGIALRDAWITLRLHEAVQVQAGRMYVPFTRQFGTTSTKSMLTTDLPFLQGGVRGNIFYAGKVGRDDGVTVWGNPLDGLLQYRFMVSEGVEGANNPHDRQRFAGRLALNLLDPEPGWFKQGTYLGEKKVLAFGFGADYQPELTLNGTPGMNNFAWTLDMFLDHPAGRGAVTAEASYIDIHNSSQTHNLSTLSSGDDGRAWYLQGGYLLPGQLGKGRLQPYFRYEAVSVTGKEITNFYSGGLNYYIRGHNAKFSLDYSFVDQTAGGRPDQPVITAQLAIGF